MNLIFKKFNFIDKKDLEIHSLSLTYISFMYNYFEYIINTKYPLRVAQLVTIRNIIGRSKVLTLNSQFFYCE
jgi:hypothetical protein